tara:strand:- start:2993 stop:3598 length:606 start_codon:yes stop_codon:yes gene_type:complete
MKHTLYYHRHADQIVKSDLKFKDDYNELIAVIDSISDNDLIEAFNMRKTERPNIKSLSEPINHILKERLTLKGWIPESPIFYDKVYRTLKKWRLDFVKNNIALEVAFNHGEAIAHNIMKPVLSSELNHVEKDIQTGMGVIICATNDLKKAGNFDGAVGSFEKFIEYFKPYQNLLPTSIVLIGLNSPSTFFIDKDSKEIMYK